MSICLSPVSTSSFTLPDSLLTSSSLLIHLASPPFSFLPLPPPDPDELFAFDQLPRLLRPISDPLDDQSQASSSSHSLSSCSSRRSNSSHPMSASDSLRGSISSTASSSLESISEGSIHKPISLVESYGKQSEDGYSLRLAEVKETLFPSVPAKEKDWPCQQSEDVITSSLLDRLRPLIRTNTLLSQHSRRNRQERQKRDSHSSSNPSVKVVVQRELTMTSQTFDQSDSESCLNFISQTAAWKMMQYDCKANQVFCDINTILRHAPFATSCMSPTSPTYRHREIQPSSFSPFNTSPPYESSLALIADSDEGKRLGSPITSLLTRFRRRKNRQGSQASTSSQASSVLVDPTSAAGEDELLQASRTLGLFWGCAARKIWDTDREHQPCSVYFRPETSEIDTGPSIESGDVKAKAWTIEHDASHLQQWSTFYQAYSQGQVDLSMTPRVPKGVPDVECCPMATPAGLGGLDAPIPDWEILRARAYCRLELDRLQEQTLKVVAEKVASCLMALNVHKSVLHSLHGDTVLRLTSSGFQPEEESRQQSLCAHTILNRNKGMVVQDLAKDWRFGNAQKDDADSKSQNYYAGMPIVAANGLPVAILSVWDAQRDFSVEPHFLKRMAREIGQVFEEHYRQRWEVKICKMTRSVELIQRSLGEGVYGPRSRLEGNAVCTLQSGSDSDQPSWSTTYDFDSLQALADLGILVSLEDVNRLRLILREMASLLGLEMMYLAAIPLEDDKHFKQATLPLAHHNLEGNTLSPRFHQTLFSSQANNEDDVDIYKRYSLRQNNCMTLRGTSQQQIALHPFIGGDHDLKAMLILPVAEKRRIGFVLGALTQSKTKVVGVEDLRYIEAVRPNLCAAIDKFMIAHHHSEAAFSLAMDEKWSGRALSLGG